MDSESIPCGRDEVAEEEEKVDVKFLIQKFESKPSETKLACSRNSLTRDFKSRTSDEGLTRNDDAAPALSVGHGSAEYEACKDERISTSGGSVTALPLSTAAPTDSTTKDGRSGTGLPHSTAAPTAPTRKDSLSGTAKSATPMKSWAPPSGDGVADKRRAENREYQTKPEQNSSKRNSAKGSTKPGMSKDQPPKSPENETATGKKISWNSLFKAPSLTRSKNTP